MRTGGKQKMLSRLEEASQYQCIKIFVILVKNDKYKIVWKKQHKVTQSEKSPLREIGT